VSLTEREHTKRAEAQDSMIMKLQVKRNNDSRTSVLPVTQRTEMRLTGSQQVKSMGSSKKH